MKLKFMFTLHCRYIHGCDLLDICNEEKFITNRYLIVTYLMKSSVNVQNPTIARSTTSYFSGKKVVAKIINLLQRRLGKKKTSWIITLKEPVEGSIKNS